jgi:hypothetical protein
MKCWDNNIEIDGDWYTTRAAARVVKTAPVNTFDVRANSVVESREYLTREVLRKIQSRSRAGKLLLTLINSNRRTLKIVPVGADQYGETGTQTVACNKSKCFKIQTDSVIWFEPTCWGTSMTARVDPGKHMLPDDVLFHEMVHSLRQKRGCSGRRRWPALTMWRNFMRCC